MVTFPKDQYKQNRVINRITRQKIEYLKGFFF